MDSNDSSVTGAEGANLIGRRVGRSRTQVVQAARWTLSSTIVRQALQVGGAIFLARILGPQTYGVISIATLFTVITGLLLDQGLAAALIQKPVLAAALPGAVATLNLLISILLGILTWWSAPYLSIFFGAPPLTPVLRALAVALPLKAGAIVPRAMLNRDMNFRRTGIADISGAMVGTIAGLTAAALGAGALSVVFLTVATDVTVLTVLLASGHRHAPNLRVRLVKEILPFSLRVFMSNGIAAFSRNTDNVLVGRYLGIMQLSFYAMAYRVLVIPVQLIGQTASRFMFPLLAGDASDQSKLARHLYVCSQALAAISIPIMAWVACASQQLVLIVLGEQWLPTAAVMSVLALAGARESIFYITPSLMKATGHASLNLRFEVLSTLVQVGGIVVGLQFGLLGVAVGYAVAGLLITPILILIQRRLTGLAVARQLWILIPPSVCSLLGALAYISIGFSGASQILVLTLGTVAYVLVAAGASALFGGWRREMATLIGYFLRRNSTAKDI